MRRESQASGGEILQWKRREAGEEAAKHKLRRRIPVAKPAMKKTEGALMKAPGGSSVLMPESRESWAKKAQPVWLAAWRTTVAAGSVILKLLLEEAKEKEEMKKKWLMWKENRKSSEKY